MHVATTVACPHCGASATHELALGVRGDHAATRAAILGDTFQRFQCDACRASYVVEAPFTYLDPERRHFFMCFAARDETRWRELEGESTRLHHDNIATNAAPIAHRILGGPWWIRSVFGFAALREKLLIAAHGLDDRIVEATKLELVLVRGALLHPARRARLFQRSADPASAASGDALGVRIWRDPEHAEDHVFPRDIYAAVTASPGHEALIAQLGAGPYVDFGRVMLAGTPSDAPEV